MLPLALVPQRPRTLWETSSTSRSMRYASNNTYSTENVLTRVLDQGRCPQGGSEELDIALDQSGVKHHE